MQSFNILHHIDITSVNSFGVTLPLHLRRYRLGWVEIRSVLHHRTRSLQILPFVRLLLPCEIEAVKN